MPDQPDDAQLTPDQEAEVRRLLAGSRHTDPTPDAVVARLDRVLADLADEPVREAAVVRLADRRRRAATMLVAAAAVIVVGVGLGQLLPQGGGDSNSSTAAGSVEPGATADESGAEAEAPATGPSAEALERSKRHAFRLDARRFSRDARLLVDAPLAALSFDDRSDGGNEVEEDYSSSGSAADLDSLARAGRSDVCDPGDWGQGTYVAVVYEKAPGWVVLRRPQGSSQIVDLFLCGSESAVRSVTLPSR